MESLRNYAAGTAVALLLTSLLAGCGTTGEPKSAEQRVQARAQERWDALVNGDIATAYRYFSPGSQAVTDFDAYRRTIRPGFWKSVKVQQVNCATAEACEARALVEYEFRGSRISTPVTESWVRQDGNWWYVHK